MPSKVSFADRRMILLKIEREYNDLEEIRMAEKAQVQGSAHIKEDVDKLKADIVRLQRESKLDKVAELQYGKLPQLEVQLKAAEKAGDGEQKDKLLRTQVGIEKIVEVVSRATGTPVPKMMQGEREKLSQMEDLLHQLQHRQ